MMEKFGIDILFKGNNMLRLLGGLGVALKISLISVVISLIIGLALGMLLTQKSRVVSVGFSIYLAFVRIMPQMVLLFIVFFGATRSLGLQIPAETASVIVFSFWGVAEMADLVRGALNSIPTIQYESGLALGMNKRTLYLNVIVPQAARRLIPLSINLITRMIKTTSLVMMIGIVEVLKVGQQIIEANRRTSKNAAFGIFAVIFLLYFLACWPISQLAKYLEKKWEN